MSDFKPIIYKEQNAINFILRSDTVEFTWSNALLLAKHYRHSLNYGDVRIRNSIIDFFSKKDINFNYVRHRNAISKIIRKSEKKMVDTGNIDITEFELDKIGKIRNFKHQKICLAVLLISKRDTNNKYISQKDWHYIRNIVSRKITNSDIYMAFHSMYELGMTEPIGASQKINISEEKDGTKVIFKISNDREAYRLMVKYISYKGGIVGFCPSCGKEFLKDNDRRILCDSCRKDRNLLKHRKYNQKRKRHNDHTGANSLMEGKS